MQTVLNVLLTILKWIGLILLWILRIVFGIIAFVILLVILILSIPLRFHVKGHYRADDIQAEGSVSYLFKLIQAKFFFQDSQLAFSVKAFGKTLMESKPKEKETPLEKKDSEETEKKESVDPEKKEDSEVKPEVEKTEPEKSEPENADAAEKVTASEKEEPIKAEDASIPLPAVTEQTPEPEKKVETEKSQEEKVEESADKPSDEITEKTVETLSEKSTPKTELSKKEQKELKKAEAEKNKEAKKQEKLAKQEARKKAKEKKPEPEEDENGIPKWAQEVMTPIGPGKLEAIWEKIGALLAKIDSYYALVRFYPDKRGLVRAIKRLFIHLGKAFHFKPSELSLVYGMDDPVMLAQIIGAVYAVMAASQWKKLNLSVQPAFCEDRIEVEGDLNFTLVLRTLVGAVLGLVINISVWKLVIYLIKLRKKGKKQNGSK